MITQTQFFLVGIDTSSHNTFHMYKFTFSSKQADWANMIACASGNWASSNSESLLSADGLNIYLFFIYGPSPTNWYFTSVSSSDGSVTSSRYKSSASVQIIYGSALNGDYVIATTKIPFSLIIYNLSSSVFIIKLFSGSVLYGWGVEPSSGR